MLPGVERVTRGSIDRRSVPITGPNGRVLGLAELLKPRTGAFDTGERLEFLLGARELVYFAFRRRQAIRPRRSSRVRLQRQCKRLRKSVSTETTFARRMIPTATAARMSM